MREVMEQKKNHERVKHLVVLLVPVRGLCSGELQKYETKCICYGERESYAFLVSYVTAREDQVASDSYNIFYASNIYP